MLNGRKVSTLGSLFSCDMPEPRLHRSIMSTLSHANFFRCQPRSGELFAIVRFRLWNLFGLFKSGCADGMQSGAEVLNSAGIFGTRYDFAGNSSTHQELMEADRDDVNRAYFI